MFVLRKTDGELVRSDKTGQPLTFSEWKWADAGARILRKTHGPLTVIRAA